MNLSVHNFKTLGIFWLSTAAVRFRQNGGFKIAPQLIIHKTVVRKQKMRRIIITILTIICVNGMSFGQIKVTGRIFKDTTLTKPFPRIKVILKSENSEKKIRSDRNGKYIIQNKKPNGKVFIEFRKRGYMTLVLELNKKKSEHEFDIVLRKISGPHDKEYFGVSKFIKRN